MPESSIARAIDSRRWVDDHARARSINLMKPLSAALALLVALAATGVAVVFTQSQSPAGTCWRAQHLRHVRGPALCVPAIRTSARR